MQSDCFSLECFNYGAFINHRRGRLVGISVPQAAFCCVAAYLVLLHCWCNSVWEFDVCGCSLFAAVLDIAVGCVQGWELGPRASPSKVYPPGKLHWHFTCGFDFRHSLWLAFEAAFVVLKGSKVVFTSLYSIGYNFGKMNR